eukprot:symbB.v1.2.041418.t1/scaffold8155.1/size7492/1
MTKRKLSEADTPREQYEALQSIQSLQASQRRAVVKLLNPEGRGGSTTKSQEQQHGSTYKLLREIPLESCEEGLDVAMHVMSLPGLVQEKVNACALYKAQMRDALKRSGHELTLIFYCNEVNSGNILSPHHPRKANVTYIAFLEQEILFLESLWLTLCVVRANEAQQCNHGYCQVVRKQLEHIREETKHGFPLEIDGNYSLVVLKKVLLLGDHDGLRSLTGAKGASGLKPCLKCSNVLALNRSAKKHCDISEPNISKCQFQTQERFQDTLSYLRACRTKKDLAEAETLTGWNLEAVSHSCLTSPDLSAWVDLDSLYFDVMHQYWSCGMIAAELGLWYTALDRAGVRLQQIRTWILLGWKHVSRGVNHVRFFDEKLWRPNRDFRGDAATCAAVLPLCYGFSEEMLQGHFEGLQNVLNSLRSLSAVVLCIQWTKEEVSHGSNLEALQKEHMKNFIQAHSADVVRPKMHYALHVPTQCGKWSRLIDTFVCERKHRTYKSQCGTTFKKLFVFSKSVLQHLATHDVRTASPVERYTGQLLGKAREDPATAQAVRISENSLFAKGLEFKCVSYLQGQFLLASGTLAVEIHAGVFCKEDQTFWLLVEPLLSSNEDADSLHTWKRTACRRRCLLSASQLCDWLLPQFVRETEHTLCILL